MKFLFEPERLHEIATKVIGLPHDELSPRLREELTRAYPGHISERDEWLFNIAAGATGIMNVLHGSVTEYLLVFGSPIGTEAYSGRYALAIHDFVLAGEMWTYTEDHPGERIVTKEGQHAVLKPFQSKGFRIAPDTWMLEYGRGFVPSSLPCALSDTLIGALDVPTVLKTFRVYGGLMLKELLKGKL